MPFFARAATPSECECEHCSFTFKPPDSSASAVVRCPRCWRPVSGSQPSEPPPVVFQPVDSDTASEIEVLTSDTTIQSNDVLEELVQNLETENQVQADDFDITDEELDQLTPDDLEALGFGHLVTVVHANPPPQTATVRPQPKKSRPPDQQKQPAQENEQQPEPPSLSDRIKRGIASYSISLVLHLVLMILAALIVYQSQDFRWHGEIDGAHESIGEGGGLELQAPIEFEAPLPRVEANATESLLTGNLGQGFGKSSGKGGIGFFGTRAQGKSFVFVVDISGSMTNPLPQPPSRELRRRREREPEELVSRWDKAREELMRAVDAMSEKQSFAVMLYNDSHYEFQRDGKPVGLMRATQRNKDDVRMWLNSIDAQGGTEPQLSMHEALKLKPEVVFFLTDGIIPVATRDTARESNIGKSVIHTTCIGSLENTILQLIANDHGGRFRTVGGMASNVGSDGITLVCFVSSEPSNRLKFKRIEDDLERFESNFDKPLVLLKDNSHSLLILHNAASDIPKFTQEVQRLIKELNSGTRAGFDMQIGSGRLGVNLPLDDLDLRFSDDAVAIFGRRKMTIRKVLETSVSEDDIAAPQSVNSIYVFGDLDAKHEILAALEVFNLYNGSIIKLVDGEEFVKQQR